MLLEHISKLTSVCDEDERDLIEKMIFAAADYVRTVVYMETKAFNYAGQSGDELRTSVSLADGERRNCHNALISYVDIVNRLCASHQMPLIYTAGSLRRCYGDFALQLSTEIFNQR